VSAVDALMFLAVVMAPVFGQIVVAGPQAPQDRRAGLPLLLRPRRPARCSAPPDRRSRVALAGGEKSRVREKGAPVSALGMDAVLESSKVRRNFSDASAKLIIIAGYGRLAGEGREVTHAAH
jgi:hypothetical protein